MLDPHGRQEVMDIIEKLNREGITILLITHFMEEAARADRVVIMDQGKVMMDGTPAQVFAKEEEIRALHLDVPFAVALASRLRRRGIPVPESVIEESEVVDYLCQYK
jgi:energy-coupling factor transport system ATP-binding protein